MDPRSVAKYIEDAEHLQMAHRLYTLIFPLDRQANRVLLGMKKRGFGKNKYNGFGGKVEAHETIAAGAMRELHEESGLSARSLDKHGILFFYFEGDSVAMEVHVYVTGEYAGRAVETDEMRPEWFDMDGMPFEKMWADDPEWWPMVLEGKRFVGRFWFKNDMVTITRREVAPVDSLEFSG
ncbi:hypothetical protein LPJ53_004795 [Coemansia erecta]|uniref:Oxidized purine nucleoside triphosphate hydrolase n=1 Tax=Coemansia erecta TaxID=147472 RepID=A0A9W7XX06_9FUNG|nr:hypothetical protein LPJ53_004795 [Coemansia erecta]